MACFLQSQFFNEMTERYSRIQQILDREKREFEEAMREQVITFSCSAYNLNNLDFNKCSSEFILSPTREKYR